MTPNQTAEWLRTLTAEKSQKRTLRPAPDGPVLEYWNSLDLAQVLEQEVNKAAATGMVKISLHMDLEDALRLSRSLRKLALLG